MKSFAMLDKPVKTLASFQQDFAQAIINSQNFDELIPVNRCEVYQNNYQQTLYQSLAATFIQTQKLLGDSFKQLAFDYIQNHPSTDENLNLYGSSFVQFINTQKNSLYSDIAQYDYLKKQCYYAENHTAFKLQDFLALEQKQQLEALFIKPKSLLPIYSQYPLMDIIQGLDKLALEKPSWFLLKREYGKVICIEITQSCYDSLLFFSKPRCLKTLNEQQLCELPILLEKGYLTIKEHNNDDV